MATLGGKPWKPLRKPICSPRKCVPKLSLRARGWKVQFELPHPVYFTTAATTVRLEDVDNAIPAGPEVERRLRSVSEYIEARVGHLALAYPGDDFEGFFNSGGVNDDRPSQRHEG